MSVRATEWQVPRKVAADGQILRIWDREMRLRMRDAGASVELQGPMHGLWPQLQDSATEILEDAGLSILWDRVDTGALAPGLSPMCVRHVTCALPGFWRVRLAASDAARFSGESLYFRLLLPTRGSGRHGGVAPHRCLGWEGMAGGPGRPAPRRLHEHRAA